MTTPREREFDRFDAIVLFAATVVGFGLIRAWERAFGLATVFDPGIWHGQIVDRVTAVTIPFLLQWTVACLLLRLRRPRPNWRRVARQPGTAACVAAMLAIAYASFWTTLTVIKVRSIQRAYMKGYIPSARSYFYWIYGDPVAFWVLGAGLTLALGCRWRSEPSWIDRLGRILGLAWIMVKAVPYVSSLLTR
jgi:succinate dehydrogenase hydrophobic anchor subunit